MSQSNSNSKPTATTTTAPGPVPPSLRQLVEQIEHADEHKVAIDLARTAEALIEAAWNGSMCVGIMRRTIPLADAIQRSTAALDAASIAYITIVPAEIRAVVGDAFDVAEFTQDNLKSFKHLKSLDFAGLGTVHYEHIQAAITTDEDSWRGGPLNDEVFIIQQFCQRIVDLLESLKERTGHRIANDIMATVTANKSDAPSASAATDDVSIAVREVPRVPLVYNSAAGRIYGGRNWRACVKGPFDWALLFGQKDDDHDDNNDDDNNDDDDDDGPWLTPRMAACLHHVAIRDAEQLFDNWKVNPPKLPKVARPFFKRSKEWRESFRECYLRIGMRLQKGLPPYPNCTGEELALHNIIWIAQDIEHDYINIFEGIPEFQNDKDYMLVLDNAVEDQDVMMLFDNGGNESDDDPTVDNPVLGPGSMASFALGSGGNAMRVNKLHPSEWFHAFRDEDFKNHLP